MPAEQANDPDVADGSIHIYNEGVEKRVIFNDKQDYEVFIGYLRDYLSEPVSSESTKKTFIVNGKTFIGTPHQPKNYIGKVELVAYSLMPNHFHLLLSQTSKEFLQSFIRSLCTRYSMYFNKKYKRSGTLFRGPYKSAYIRNDSTLPLLTLFFHKRLSENGKQLTDSYTSYPEFLGLRLTSWVKPKGMINNYKDFVEKHVLDQNEEELLKRINFESETQHLEKSDPTRSAPPTINSTATTIKTPPVLELEPLIKIPEFLIISVSVFLLLFGLGVKHIIASTNPTNNVSQITQTLPAYPSPIVLGTKTEEKPKTMVILTTDNGAKTINIYQKPAINSEKVGVINDGDSFELVYINAGWYNIKLVDGLTGFIQAKYIEKGGPN